MPTEIEWTDETWNPVRGCSMAPGSELAGCLNCYAARMAARNLPGLRSPVTGRAFAIITDNGPRWTGEVELIESRMREPLHWRRPRRVFVNSMSDLFHEKLSYVDVLHVFQIMGKCTRHTFQILTKRPAKMRESLQFNWWRNLNSSGRPVESKREGYWRKLIAGTQRPEMGDLNFLPNVWLGVSVENRACLWRVDELRATPAAVRFLSLEPLLEDLGELDLTGIGWVIAGGESGPGARPIDPPWVRSIRDQCKAAAVPFFFKQWGGSGRPAVIGPAADITELDGAQHREFPAGR
jgi:protein gp37